MGLISSIGQIDARRAAYGMAFDAMVDKKNRPDVPEFFDTKKPVGEMTDIERMLAMGQISPQQAAKMHAKAGFEKWKKEQEAMK